MLPGDFQRLIKRHAKEPGEVNIYMMDTGDQSDAHRATLRWRDEDVCAVPVGEVPERNIYEYECHQCGTRALHPWVCKAGMPPDGMERRGLEFLAEPSGQGHNVFRRLVRRGAEEVLEICRQQVDEHGRKMLRG